jgi:hypothetical protein
VRQISKATAFPDELQRFAARAAPAATVVPQPFSWRKTSGTFQVTITIGTKEELLFPEERLLAWLKWKVSVFPKTLRFYPVLKRYLGVIIGRVGGFGGDPGQLPLPPATCRGIFHRRVPSRSRRAIVGGTSSSSPARSCR